MNKGRRQELTRLKFIKRLKKYGLLEKIDDPTHNLWVFKSHGAPCSCDFCSNNKYKRKQKHKNKDYETN